MGDAILDAVASLLATDVVPAFPLVLLGKPAVLDVDRSCFVWYGGDSGDSSAAVRSLGDISATEHLDVSVLWARPAGAAPDLLAEHEYEARAAIRQIKKVLHAHAALAGTVAAGLISTSECGAATSGIWRDEGGALFDMVTVPWIFTTLGEDLVGV